MKQPKRKTILFLIILLILIIFLFQRKKKQSNNFQEELIFFKLFTFQQKENANSIQKQENQEYKFQVSYKNIDFKNINLSDTIKQDTLVHEKIAPGTEGAFEIFLQSNRKINYRIHFKSINEKPENLYFQIEGKDRKYTRLENMEQELKGELIENKRIKIHWKWEYEKDDKQDTQDTKDGQLIGKYHFTIYAIGE